MTTDMKHNIHRLVILFAIMFTASGVMAQNDAQKEVKNDAQKEVKNDNQKEDQLKAEKKAQRRAKLHSEAGLFNHLSVGLNVGLTGLGIDAAMPVHKLVTVKAGFSIMPIGDIKFKAINTSTDITQTQMVEDDAVRRAQMVDKVELALKPNLWNFYLLGEVHPFKNVPFYFAAGLYIGSKHLIHFFRTNYPPIGLKFGDYVFTADKDGNIDVRMKTNVVKPYIGIGFGQQLAKYHRLSLAVDAGLMFWGTPKFVLNNDVEIKSSGKNSGITGALSWLKAWPNLQVRVAYKIF